MKVMHADLVSMNVYMSRLMVLNIRNEFFLSAEIYIFFCIGCLFVKLNSLHV